MTIVDHVPFWSGLALLLLGWALYWIAVTTAGSLLFGLTALAAATLACRVFEVDDSMRLGIQVGSLVLGGLGGALLFRFLSRFAFFAVGAVIGAAGAYALVQHAQGLGQEWAQGMSVRGFAPVVGGLVCGFIFAAADDLILAAASSVIGGILLMMGLGWPMDGLPILTIVPGGFLFQVGLTRNRKRMKKDDEEDDD